MPRKERKRITPTLTPEQKRARDRANGAKGGRPRVGASTVRLPAVTMTGTPRTLYNPFKLTPLEYKFVTAYCGVARFNAAGAYRLAGYRGSDDVVRKAAVEIRRRVRVKQAIDDLIARQTEPLQAMTGEEAVLRMSEFARADIRPLLPQELQDLPAHVTRNIKAIRPGPYGYTIEVYSALQATETMLRVTGKLRETAQHAHTHMTLAQLVGLSFHPNLANLPVADDPCTLPAAVVPPKEGE